MPEIEPVYNFVDIMNDLKVYNSAGDPMGLQDAMNFEIAKVVKQVAKLGKPGAISLTLSFSPERMNTLTINGTLAAKAPKNPAPGITAYTDRKGDLYAEDPDQMRLALEKVTPLKESV